MYLRHTAFHACQPSPVAPDAPAVARPRECAGAGRGAGGVGAHDPPRRRRAERRRRADLGRPRPSRRLPAAAGLAHARRWPDRARGAGDVPGRAAGPGGRAGAGRSDGVGAVEAAGRAAGRLARGRPPCQRALPPRPDRLVPRPVRHRSPARDRAGGVERAARGDALRKLEGRGVAPRRSAGARAEGGHLVPGRAGRGLFERRAHVSAVEHPRPGSHGRRLRAAGRTSTSPRGGRRRRSVSRRSLRWTRRSCGCRPQA